MSLSPAGAPPLPGSPAQAALREAYSRPEPRDLPVLNANGRAIDCEANALYILTDDLHWKGVIALDEFAGRAVKLREPPFARGFQKGPWTDLDTSRLAVWINEQYQLKFKVETLNRAIAVCAADHPFDPVRQYLESLLWDGERRLRHWMETYLGAGDAIGSDEDGPKVLRYLQLVGIKTLVGAVARVFNPGCKLDTMTILEGPQGLLKSSAWRVLGGTWFTDAYLDVHSKEPLAIIQGMWIVEWSELEGMARAELSAVKRFLSQPADRYRTWYGTRAETVPRRCVFVGSINAESYLRDVQNRRYWPVRCGRIDLDELKRDRDQLFAEAVRWYRHGVRWWVEGAERELFEVQQERREEADAFEDRVRSYVDATASDDQGPRRDVVSIAEVLEHKYGLGLRPERWAQAEQKRVARVLHQLGFKRFRPIVAGRRGWVWRRKVDNGG